MHRISPRPWIGGSSANLLVDQMMIVHRALENAAREMRTWYPHGRDYQIGPDSGEQHRADQDEAMRRLKLVEDLAAQYENEAYAISKKEV